MTHDIDIDYNGRPRSFSDSSSNKRKSPTPVLNADVDLLDHELLKDTPLGRFEKMSTPMSSRAGSVTKSPSCCGETPGSRRRSSSGLSWHEDRLEDFSVKSSPCRAPDDLYDSPVAKPSNFTSLSQPGLLARLCCVYPAFALFSLLSFQIFTAIFFRNVFYATTAVLTGYVLLIWTAHMSIFSVVGAWRMRRAASIDWHAKLLELQKKLPDSSDVTHIVILPNYKEDEDMLFETLENIGRSALAKESIRVVLGMEEREGEEAYEKAERLIAKAGHLFADIFAAFHPPGRHGEIAGKSSNSQWAYRAALERYADYLSTCDPARVFLSVGDADTLWNPQYFDALSFEALSMCPAEAAWTIWQPPMLLFRNLFAVPCVTRLAGFGTLLFELSGCTNQSAGSHFCFSSYSLTLALASHRNVAGWDTDVIAEDHHMFIKCFFASMWEAVERKEKDASVPCDIEARVRLQPIYLPAEGYLVESSAGYLQSCWARFQQARRHTQGVSELGYGLLQYARLLRACGPLNLPLRAHLQILAILWKMQGLHIVNSVQAASLLLCSQFMTNQLMMWVWTLGPSAAYQELLASVSGDTWSFASKAIFTTFGPAPPIGILSAACIFVVVRDVIEGRYVQGCDANANKSKACRLSRWQSVVLAARLQFDMLTLAEPTILFYQLLPECLAAWSLIRRGQEFEYIVAEKPGEASQALGAAQ